MSAQKVTPFDLLAAYAHGLFPMADSADTHEIYWVNPEHRGILPLPHFHISSRFARTLRADPFEIRIDTNFASIVQKCAEPTPQRPQTWINPTLFELYLKLFELNYAHSVEVYDARGICVGGLYGVALRGAFFGESMFHRARDASKIALAYLVAQLIEDGFLLLDTQFITPHLERLGAIEIPRALYVQRLEEALRQEVSFRHKSSSFPKTGAEVVAFLRAHAEEPACRT